MSDDGEAVRLALLQVTIAGFFNADPALVLSPTCPRCNHGPTMVINLGQAFCGEDDCDVLMWNPTLTREQFNETAQEVRITERVTCTKCKRTYKCTPDDDYYEPDPHLGWTEGKVCFACLVSL